MRLITRTTLLYLLLILAVFGIGGIFIYKSVQSEITTETDYALQYHLSVIKEGLEVGRPVESFQSNKVKIQKLEGQPVEKPQPVFSDTLAMHPQLNRLEMHRKLSVIQPIREANYRIEIMDVIVETGDVFEGVVTILTRLFLFLSIVFILFSFLISRQLFKPFQLTLQKISGFNLNSNKQLNLPPSSIKEFDDLNRFLMDMTTKARKDYLSLKEFSENASHEMQTPIAIAKGKLEILLESTDLKPEQFQLIESAQESLSKLSKLGQSLALLTKIENKEFSNVQPIDFSRVVSTAVANFKEIADLKGIQLNSEIENGVTLPVDAVLADILVVNLLKNAVQHNVEGGWIQVVLSKQKLSVRNSGLPPKVTTEDLFKRFIKSNQAGSSLGLGLAIVQKIAEVSDFEIKYTFENETHELSVSFQH